MHRPAFTLLETLVAISILMVTIVGPLSVAQSSLQNSIYARDQITAFYLAQEGVEYVRAQRDQNIMNGAANWLNASPNTLDTCTVTNYGCNVDFVNFTSTACVSTGCPYLNLSGENLYTTAAGTATKYRRTVTLTSVDATQYIVKSKLEWKSGRYDKVFELEERIFKWLP